MSQRTPAGSPSCPIGFSVTAVIVILGAQLVFEPVMTFCGTIST
jgi:hypothetical protein